jgi:hypothetical protein
MKRFFRYIEENYLYLFAALGLGASVFFLMSNTQASMFFLVFSNIFYIYAQLEDIRKILNLTTEIITETKQQHEKNINCPLPAIQPSNT